MNLVKLIGHTYKEAYSGLPKEAWLLSFVEFINRSGTMVFFFMTLYLTHQLSFSTTIAGQALGIYGFGALAGSYLGGKLTDIIGAYTVQKVSLFFTGFVLIILSQVTSYILIMTFMFLLGLISETLHPANATAMSQICPSELMTKGFALNRLATNLGITIGPVLGGILATINYSYLFWVDGLTCIVAGVLFCTFFKTSRPISENISKAHTHVKSPWRDFYFLKILGLVFLIGLVFVQLFTTFPLYLKDLYRFKENMIGFLLSINTIIIVLFEMILINALKQKPMIKLVAIGSLLLCGGFAMIPLGRGFLFAGFTVAIWTIGEMLFIPALTTLIAKHSDDSLRGRYMGLFSLAFASSFIIGPTIGTWIYDHIGVDYIWIVSGFIGILTWMGFSKLKKK